MPSWVSLEWFGLNQWQSYTWESPFWLLGILTLPVLFLIRWLLYKNEKPSLALDLPPSTHTNVVWAGLRFLAPMFFSFAFVLLWVAAARPQSVIESEEEVTVGINITLALDVSESMLNTDLEPTRFEAAKNMAKTFITQRSSDKIGLVVFAGEAYSLCPLTSDHELLKTYVDEVSPNIITTSGTAIGNALAACINRLKDIPGESKVAILLSDGDNTAGDLDPLTAVELAKTFGIRIYTIALGSNALELDSETLEQIAMEGDGLFFQASDKETLENSFDQISALETVRFNNRVVKEVRDYYSIYLNWALLFLVVSFVVKSSFLGNVLED